MALLTRAPGSRHRRAGGGARAHHGPEGSGAAAGLAGEGHRRRLARRRARRAELRGGPRRATAGAGFWLRDENPALRPPRTTPSVLDGLPTSARSPTATSWRGWIAGATSMGSASPAPATWPRTRRSSRGPFQTMTCPRAGQGRASTTSGSHRCSPTGPGCVGVAGSRATRRITTPWCSSSTVARGRHVSAPGDHAPRRRGRPSASAGTLRPYDSSARRLRTASSGPGSWCRTPSTSRCSSPPRR